MPHLRVWNPECAKQGTNVPGASNRLPGHVLMRAGCQNAGTKGTQTMSIAATETTPSAWAQHIAQSVTDGQWADGQRLDDPAPAHYTWPRTPGTFHRALKLLAARGEIVGRHGRYYTRAGDERS
jgi:hypothetical protein